METWAKLHPNENENPIPEMKTLRSMKKSSIFPPLGLLLFLLGLGVFPAQHLVAQDGPLAAVASSSNQFGFQLYQKIASQAPNSNQFMSPFSVYAALAMTSEGTAGNSLEVLRKTLALPDETTLHAGLEALAKALQPQNASYALAVANAIWPSKTAKLNPVFVATIQKIYQGASIPQDFQNNSELARTTINNWVAKRTNDRIKNLLPAGSVNSSTAIVLTNAIFFKGKWQFQFDKKETSDQAFFSEAKKEIAVPMMHLAGSDDFSLAYGQTADYEVLRLPYKGDALSMVILLPNLGGMAAFEKAFDAKQWAQLNEIMELKKVNVWLPRFKMELGGSIAGDLKSLGLAPLFENADFTRMFTSGGGFKISDVIHKAFVEVNEEGTEAAAATAVLIAETAVEGEYEPEINFRADHPFLFMIEHNASHSILFMGKVMNPAG